MKTKYKYSATVSKGGRNVCKVSSNSLRALKLTAKASAMAFGEKGKLKIATDCGKLFYLVG